MSKFTAGPWEVSVYRDEIQSGDPWMGKPFKTVGHVERYSVIAPSPTNEDTVLVAEINTSVRNPWKPPADQLADARLIAAAPDLYRIATMLHAWFAVTDTIHGSSIPFSDGPEEETLRDAVRAVMAKVEG